MPWYRINGMQVHVKLGGKAAKTPPAPGSRRWRRSAALDYVLACAAGDEPIAQPQSAADALLPCPFCGGAGAVIDR